ncbi:MAG: potassium channel family protein [Parashewanella sp.]
MTNIRKRKFWLTKRTKGASPFELAMMLLSFFAVLIMLVLTFGQIDKETHQLLFFIDTGICFIFISNFFFSLFKAKSKRHYFKRHWIDLVASIPAVEPLRAARIFQILRVIRLVRSSRTLLIPLIKQKKEATLASLLLAVVTILSFASVVILFVESGAEGANIHTAEEAIWWALVTISTVGYGDYYPVTTIGHIIGSIVIIAGVSFFGVVSGFMASIFVTPDEAKMDEKHKQHQRQVKLEIKQALEVMQENQIRMEQNQRVLLNEIHQLRQRLDKS